MYPCLLIIWLSMYMSCAVVHCKTWRRCIAILSYTVNLKVLCGNTVNISMCMLHAYTDPYGKLGRTAVTSSPLCIEAQISFAYLGIHKASRYSRYVTTCCFDRFTDSNQSIFPLNSNKFTTCILQQRCYETLSFQTIISKPCFIR